MKTTLLPIIFILLMASCTSQKKLAYLNNLPETGEEETFLMDIPNYRIQMRDIIYITVKAMTPDGAISDLISSGSSGTTQQDESGGYLTDFVVNREGNILIPVIGEIKVGGLTLHEIRNVLQKEADKIFKNSTVECKLRSFKFTVIGEVKNPGSYLNYNNYLTVIEAIGRAGGLGDFGDRSKILIIRPVENEIKTFTINLQDKKILSSSEYFLLPNDVVIVQPLNQKIFNLNTPTFSFILSTIASTISTTLLLIFFFQK